MPTLDSCDDELDFFGVVYCGHGAILPITIEIKGRR
jgi:hypothetical protein